MAKLMKFFDVMINCISLLLITTNVHGKPFFIHLKFSSLLLI